MTSDAVPPRTIEEQLAVIWCETLGVDGVRGDDNFFDLGGDSLVAIQVSARAAEVGIPITARQVFEEQTVAGLARILHDALGRDAGERSSVPSGNPPADFPLAALLRKARSTSS